MNKRILIGLIGVFLLIDAVLAYLYFGGPNLSNISFIHSQPKKSVPLYISSTPTPTNAPTPKPATPSSSELQKEVYLIGGTAIKWDNQKEILTFKQEGKESTVSAKSAKLYTIGWSKNGQPVVEDSDWNNLQFGVSTIVGLCQTKDCHSIKSAFSY